MASNVGSTHTSQAPSRVSSMHAFKIRVTKSTILRVALRQSGLHFSFEKTSELVGSTQASFWTDSTMVLLALSCPEPLYL